MKEQIEEMAKVIAKEDDTCRAQTIAKALYNAGYRKQEWISVEDSLPERAGKYLVATFDGRVGIGNLIDYYCDGDLSFDNYKVTHWMPLPEPPMKGGAE